MTENEGFNQLYEKIVQLKLESSDGKKYLTDTANNEYSSLLDPNSYTGEIAQKEGISGLLRYLNSPQYYAIATVPTDWNCIQKTSFLFGKVGFHAFIRLPGQRQCEWTMHPTDWDAECHQIEIRTATGKVIEELWNTHKALYPLFHKVGDPISREGYFGYFPFVNDCHTYINLILTSSNQPESKLKRLR